MHLYFAIFFPLILIIKSDTVLREYGPYEVVVTKCQSCKRVKPSDKIVSDFRLDNKNIVLNLTVKAKCKLDSMKIISYIGNGSKLNTDIWTINAKDVCNHYMTGFAIMIAFNTTSCLIKPGKFVTKVNLNEYLHKVNIKEFIFAYFKTKFTVYSGKEIATCIALDSYTRPVGKQVVL